MRNVLVLITGLTTFLAAHAAAPVNAAKEKVVEGVAKCAKCALHESASCQTVIELKKGAKKPPALTPRTQRKPLAW
jgi:hypothetical protein